MKTIAISIFFTLVMGVGFAQQPNDIDHLISESIDRHTSTFIEFAKTRKSQSLNPIINTEQKFRFLKNNFPAHYVLPDSLHAEFLDTIPHGKNSKVHAYIMSKPTLSNDTIRIMIEDVSVYFERKGRKTYTYHAKGEWFVYVFVFSCKESSWIFTNEYHSGFQVIDRKSFLPNGYDPLNVGTGRLSY